MVELSEMWNTPLLQSLTDPFSTGVVAHDRVLSMGQIQLNSVLMLNWKQLDIKLGPFTQEELESVPRNMKNRKAAGLDEIPSEVWKTRQFDDILLRHCNAVYNQNQIDRWMKGCILPFSKKVNLGLAKNYRGITVTSIAAKICNTLLRNRIEPKIDNILRKNQNGSRRNRSTTSQILTNRRNPWRHMGKKPTGDNTIYRLYQGLWFHSQRKDGTDSISIRHSKRDRRIIMILYRKNEMKVHSPGGDKDYVDIVAGVL